MNLSPDDVALYYKLMWPLQFYVNQKLNIVPKVKSVEDYANNHAYEDKLPVRNALYEHIDLLKAFVDENPAQLSVEELTIVQTWKNYVAGDFFIERFLKAGTIFHKPRSYSQAGRSRMAKPRTTQMIMPSKTAACP